MAETNIFDFFARKTSFQSKRQPIGSDAISFQLIRDEFGYYLKVIDKKGKEIEFNYLNYADPLRQVLKWMDQLLERQSFSIDWEKPSGNRIYIFEHEHLLDLLKLGVHLIDDKGNTLKFADDGGAIQLNLLKEEPNHITSSLELKHPRFTDEPFEVLSPRYLKVEQSIVEVPSLGDQAQALSYFDTRINQEDLCLFLSLFFSNVEDVDITYNRFSIEHSNNPIVVKPCMVFEAIDEDESLVIRIGQVLPGIDFQRMDQFELSKYADIDDLKQQISIRNIEREAISKVIGEVLKVLKKHQKSLKGTSPQEIVTEDNLIIIPQEVGKSFIYDELPKLLSRFQVFGAEKLKAYKVRMVTPSLQLKLGHGIDFLEGEVNLDFAGESMNLFDMLKEFEKQRYIKLNDGTHAIINEQYIKKLERLFAKQKGKTASISFFDLPLVEELIEEKVTGQAFERSRTFYKGLNELNSQKLRKPKVKATLRPYQKQGVKWLAHLQKHQLGGCLADDMGLGKTIQCIAILANSYAKSNNPSLIIMPRSLLYNWEREIKRFAPQLKATVYYGIDRNLEEAMDANLILTTYAIVRNEIEVLQTKTFHYIVLDESQQIKNINSQTAKAIMLLNGANRLALSGTPIENNLSELYSLFRFLNPAMFGTLSQFNQRYLTPIQKYRDMDALFQLRKKIYPFILRRLKKDVLKDLPDKIEQTLYIEMSEAQRKLYEDRRQFYKLAIEQQIAEKGFQQSRFFVFQALNELRQIASIPEHVSEGGITSPKLELLLNHLLETIANGHKALIFVNYLAAIESISLQLDEAGIDFVHMTGATKNRQALVDRFQQDDQCKVFVMTLKTGGTGLNLTAADTIFIYDPWWNVAAENQAIDRAHRIGQQNKVIAYKLIVQQTIEEKILELQQLKKELFDDVITSDSTSLKSISEEDIEFILA